MMSSQRAAGSAQQNDSAKVITFQVGQVSQPAIPLVPLQGLIGQPESGMSEGGGQMMRTGQQDGRMTMEQPMMSEGGQMIAGQQSGLTMTGIGQSMGQQGGQMAMGQPMMMGQQGGQMAMGQPMMGMGGQQAPLQMQPPQMQMGQPLMQTAVPQAPQMYPPPGTMMYNIGHGSVATVGSPFFNQSKLRYIPASYMWLSILTLFVIGLVCPLSLVFSVPAVVMSRKSENTTNIRKSRNYGASAVYLNLSAFVMASIISDIIVALFIQLYKKPSWYYFDD